MVARGQFIQDPTKTLGPFWCERGHWRVLDAGRQQGNSKGFRSSVPEMEMKTKYVFLVIVKNGTLHTE